jgi:hypothetical protein
MTDLDRTNGRARCVADGLRTAEIHLGPDKQYWEPRTEMSDFRMPLQMVIIDTFHRDRERYGILNDTRSFRTKLMTTTWLSG